MTLRATSRGIRVSRLGAYEYSIVAVVSCIGFTVSIVMRKAIKSVQTTKELEQEPTTTDDQPQAQYDCGQCPAICCAVYPRVQVTPRDVQRLAKHFNLTPEATIKRYTKIRGGERVLRRKKDTIFDNVCQFLDKDTRGCGIYHARPKVCRTFPEGPRCAYFDLLQFEREHQKDQNVIPLIELVFHERHQD
jgi:Fe-S-cluster containining protein